MFAPHDFDWDPLRGHCQPWCETPCARLAAPQADCSGCTGLGYLCRPTTEAAAARADPHNCTVRALPPGLGCDRSRIVHWYFKTERRCLLDAPRADFFQFGVPSTMGTLAPLMNRSASSADTKLPWRTYWGFDSFLGLPEEAPGALRPSEAMWRAGQFSMSHTLVKRSSVRRTAEGTEEYSLPAGVAPLSAERARRRVDGWYSRPRSARLRVRVVGGFYNDSLTPQLARQALPAAYVDVDCDLYVSTADVLRWLCEHRLLRVGSVVGYDDWYETPFLRGGESRAHYDAAHRFRIEFVHIQGPDVCRSMLFRVASVGVRADPGISLQAAAVACRRRPLNVKQLQVPRDVCLDRAKAMLSQPVGPLGRD